MFWSNTVFLTLIGSLNPSTIFKYSDSYSTYDYLNELSYLIPSVFKIIDYFTTTEF